MKKKLFSVLLAVALAATLFVGCGSNASDDTGSDDQKTIAFAWSYTSSDFFQALSGFFQGMYEDAGYKVEVATAEGDANLQTQQIENFVTMGVDCIMVVPVDNTGLVDAVQKAEDAGVPVVSFTSELSSASCSLVSADEVSTGNAVAELAIAWLDEAYPDAADGSVETAVLVFSGDAKGVERSNGMVDAIKADPRVKLVKTIECEAVDNETGQTTAENLFTSNPDVKLILTYNSAMGNGVNSYVMSANSGITDKAGMAIFSTDESDEAKANIQASTNNESILRGIISMGGFMDMFNDVDGVIQKLLAGEEVDKLVVGKLFPITAENVADYMTH